jgi:hypothetical protein
MHDLTHANSIELDSNRISSLCGFDRARCDSYRSLSRPYTSRMDNYKGWILDRLTPIDSCSEPGAML